MGDKDATNSAAAAAELLELTSADSQYGSLAGFSIDKKIGKGPKATGDLQKRKLGSREGRCGRSLRFLWRGNTPNAVAALASLPST